MPRPALAEQTPRQRLAQNLGSVPEGNFLKLKWSSKEARPALACARTADILYAFDNGSGMRGQAGLKRFHYVMVVEPASMGDMRRGKHDDLRLPVLALFRK